MSTTELEAAHRLNGGLVARNMDLTIQVKSLKAALSDAVELLSANQSTTTRAGLDADMVIDNANRALREGT